MKKENVSLPILLVLMTLLAGSALSDKNLNKELLKAVEQRDNAKVERLIDQGADPNFAGKEKTPLVLAVKNWDQDMVELLLQHGADPNTSTKKGATPLAYAADRGNLDLVKLLLEKGG